MLMSDQVKATPPYQKAELEVSIDVDAMMEQIRCKRAQYARVSSIIGSQMVAELRQIPIDNYANACIRGSRIHAYCTAYMKGLCIPKIDEDVLPYVSAFFEWADNNIQKLILCTTRLYDDDRRFSGEPDAVVLMKDGRRALLDIKTNAVPSKSWDIQLAAYAHLCRIARIPYDDVFILHLKKKAVRKKEGEESAANLPPDVNVKLQFPENLNASWDIFSSALSCYDFFHRKEPKS